MLRGGKFNTNLVEIQAWNLHEVTFLIFVVCKCETLNKNLSASMKPQKMNESRYFHLIKN